MSLHNKGKLGENMRYNFEYTKNLAEERHGVIEKLEDLDVTKDIRPNYYGGVDNVYEAIKVIEAWDLNFSLGSALKYISRAGKKDPNKAIEDLIKAKTYLGLEIKRLKNEKF